MSGLFLSFLRLKSGSLVAPWMTHNAANAAGFAGAWMAARLTKTSSHLHGGYDTRLGERR
jgi:hypothetical protein